MSREKLTEAGAAHEIDAERNAENIRQPVESNHGGGGFPRIGEHSEEEISDADEEGDDESAGTVAAFGADAERDGDEGEAEAGEGHGVALVELGLEFAEIARGDVGLGGEVVANFAVGEFGSADAAFGGVGEAEVPVAGFSREGDVGGAVGFGGLDHGVEQSEAELFFLLIDEKLDAIGVEVGGWRREIFRGFFWGLVEVEATEIFALAAVDEDELVAEAGLGGAGVEKNLGIFEEFLIEEILHAAARVRGDFEIDP